MGEVEVVEEDLGHAHEHLGALHPPVVAPDGHLQQHSTVQYIVVQYSTVQHSTAQYSKTLGTVWWTISQVINNLLVCLADCLLTVLARCSAGPG